MSASVSAARAAASRSRSAAAPGAARRNEAGREMRLSNGDASITNIAAREGEKRMRALLQQSLARCLPEPSAEVLALEVGRLDKALRVSTGAMAKANLQGLDRVVKIVCERDRGHRFAAAGQSHRAGRLRRAAPAINPLALPAPPFVRPQMAPQAIEKPRFAEGNGAPLVALAGDGRPAKRGTAAGAISGRVLSVSKGLRQHFRPACRRSR